MYFLFTTANLLGTISLFLNKIQVLQNIMEIIMYHIRQEVAKVSRQSWQGQGCSPSRHQAVESSLRTTKVKPLRSCPLEMEKRAACRGTFLPSVCRSASGDCRGPKGVSTAIPVPASCALQQHESVDIRQQQPGALVGTRNSELLAKDRHPPASQDFNCLFS